MTKPREPSYEELSREFYAAHFRGRAAASTVEALMYSLRERGTKALDEPDTKRRISELSEEQLHEVAARVKALKLGRGPWTAEQVGQLVETWVACHAS
jgi:transposase